METIKGQIELLNPFEENTDGYKLFQSNILHFLSLVAEKQRELDDKNMNTGFQHVYKFPLVTDNLK